MKYLMLDLVVTMLLTTFMFELMASAACVELKTRLGRGKFIRKDWAG